MDKQQETIPVLSQDNINAITDKEKSNMLNSYFSNCWNHSELPLTNPLEDNYEQNCPVHLFCTTQEIVQLIKGLDVSKANGPDGISGTHAQGHIWKHSSFFDKSIHCKRSFSQTMEGS